MPYTGVFTFKWVPLLDVICREEHAKRQKETHIHLWIVKNYADGTLFSTKHCKNPWNGVNLQNKNPRNGAKSEDKIFGIVQYHRIEILGMVQN